MVKSKKSQSQFEAFCGRHKTIESGLRPLFYSIGGSLEWDFIQTPPWFDNLQCWLQNRKLSWELVKILHRGSQPAIQHGHDAVCRYLQLLSASILTKPEKYRPAAGKFIDGIYYLNIPFQKFVSHLRVSSRAIKASVAELESFGAIRYNGSGPGDFQSIGLCYGTIAFVYGRYANFKKYVPTYIYGSYGEIKAFRKCSIAPIENDWKASPNPHVLASLSAQPEVSAFHKELTKQVQRLIPINGIQNPVRMVDHKETHKGS